MRSLLFIVCVLISTLPSQAQDEYVIVGKVLADGTVQEEVTPSHLLPAVRLVRDIRDIDQPIFFRMKFTVGPIRYLSCEVRDFVIAFECRQVGENIIIPAQGTTHLGTSELCYNPTFKFDERGEIMGCTCEDKLYDGPPRSCTHTIRTTQSDIVAAISAKLLSRE